MWPRDGDDQPDEKSKKCRRTKISLLVFSCVNLHASSRRKLSSSQVLTFSFLLSTCYHAFHHYDTCCHLGSNYYRLGIPNSILLGTSIEVRKKLKKWRERVLISPKASFYEICFRRRASEKDALLSLLAQYLTDFSFFESPLFFSLYATVSPALTYVLPCCKTQQYPIRAIW